MPDVVGCNRELRNLVADRFDLVIVRHFVGVGSQSDIKSISAPRVMAYLVLALGGKRTGNAAARRSL